MPNNSARGSAASIATSTFSFLLPLPFFAAGGFGGAAALGAALVLGGFGAPPALSRLSVALRSSRATSAALDAMLVYLLVHGCFVVQALYRSRVVQLLCRSRCVLRSLCRSRGAAIAFRYALQAMLDCAATPVLKTRRTENPCNKMR